MVSNDSNVDVRRGVRMTYLDDMGMGRGYLDDLI